MKKPCHFLAAFLLAAGAVAQTTGAQCADETDCSALCYPEHWKRQLCLFYTEIRDWRSTAISCGLTSPIPDLVWDQAQPATEQWEEARSTWLTLRQLWREQVLEEASTDSNDDIEGSGSGDTVLDFSSVEGRSEGVSGDLVEVWREEHSEWYSELQTWNSLIGRVAESEGAEPLLDPIDLWRDNLSNWADDFATYNMTFYDLCPSRP